AQLSDQGSVQSVVESDHIDVCSHRLAAHRDEHVQLVDNWTIRREALRLREVCCLLGRQRHRGIGGNVSHSASGTRKRSPGIIYLQVNGRTCRRCIRSTVWVDWWLVWVWYQVSSRTS